MTKPTEKPRKPSFLRSVTIWAALACLGVNAVFAAINPYAKMAPEARPANHSFTWWKTQAYLKEPGPDVVLLGSSLIMNPIERLDAVYEKKDLDFVHHQQSLYMQDKLAEALGRRTTNCFNFGLPGGMVSDQYMIANSLFTRDGHKPKLIVLGLAVRDFIDNTVDSASATEPFELYSGFKPINDVVSIARPSIWDKFDYWMARSSPIFAYRKELQQVSIDLTQSMLAPALSKNVRFFAVGDSSFRSSHVSEGQFIAKSSEDRKYSDNREEYRSRYRHGNPKMFKTQTAFLDRLLTLASNQGIEVMLVNMPITIVNVSMMPDGAYFNYLTLLRNEAKQRNLTFVDMNDYTTFAFGKHFRDTCHLNNSGGQLFIDKLVAEIQSNKKFVACLTEPKAASQLASSRSRQVN